LRHAGGRGHRLAAARRAREDVAAACGQDADPARGRGVVTGKPLNIPSLDGLRAASVMLVFAAHAGLKDRVPGNFGVTVFFFLSGYLITTLLRIEHDRTGRISLRDFYLRRVLRIFPP